MDSFHDLVPGSRDFFARLAANNDREWFAAHKADYEAAVKRPADLLLDDIAQRLARDMGQTVTPKLYRVHRDVRFSKDKTPYNTHLHMQWTVQGAPISFMFGASASYCKLGVGSMAFPKDALPGWRERVAGGHPVVAQAAALEAAGWDMSDPALKRVPTPFPPDHPQGAHLRRKGLVLWHEVDAGEQASLTTTLPARFAEATGFQRALSDALA
ncbi:TIGR02453 family protein [Maritimibacter sp. UBA3975]|uniref:TIGR02453 family protein n=1 Tax=Maritimibacter sp. UBA3975 TaxID=1946833 RepID=UPI000C0B9759|nr:TIGR02453 family protein [Maritimibacter sp. UBA3975]MAM60921.1 TIGR02453 family protein [Maritimibacter sp.]|tara:strand:- start:3860 stop:4498 length:639 start_codon:yes stop_codon:yes gene_type:complete